MRLTLLALALMAAPVSAAPTYLNCRVVSDEGNVTEINIAADEQNQNVTTEIVKTGFSERRPAVFSPVAVSFSSPMSFGGLDYKISRTDLTITRTLTAGDKAFVEHGTCKVQEAPKRAF